MVRPLSRCPQTNRYLRSYRSITWGILLQYFVQFGCSYIEGTASFRIPWGLQMIPAIILSVGMLAFPESPRWLVDHDRAPEALEILADLHGKGDPNSELVQLEIAEIEEQVRFERTEGAKSYLDLFRPGIFRRVTLGMSLQMWSQLSGMNIMMYYIIYVFQGAGLTGRRGNLIADSVQYVLNVLFTIPAIVYIDKWGRRPMLLAGTLLMGFWLMLVGGLQGRFGEWGTVDGARVWVISGHDGITKAVIVFSYLFVCSFAITMGPVSWTYPAEIFPMRVRAKAVAVSTAANWVFNFALAWAVPPGLSTIAYKTYFIFGTFNFAAFIHIFFMFPETAGRTLEEIEDVFNQGHVFTAWAVKRDVGKKTLQDVVRDKVGLVSLTSPFITDSPNLNSTRSTKSTAATRSLRPKPKFPPSSTVPSATISHPESAHLLRPPPVFPRVLRLTLISYPLRHYDDYDPSASCISSNATVVVHDASV